MFKLFRKYSSSGALSPDLSFIGVDMHSHLLPGLDDGLKTVEESVAFMKELKQLGYSKLICTPHILSGLYPNSASTIHPKLEEVRQALKENNVEIEIAAAAEYMIDFEFAEIVKSSKPSDLLLINGKYILIEMSYLSPSPQLEAVVFELRMMGLEPIMAHPERYGYYHNNFKNFERLVELGCKLQINLLSLTGVYGPMVKKVAEKLIDKKMVDFVGTDMHHDKHLALLQQMSVRQDAMSLLQSIELKNLSLL